MRSVFFFASFLLIIAFFGISSGQAYLDVTFSFLYKGFNFTSVSSLVSSGDLPGGISETLSSGDSWGPYYCNSVGILSAKVFAKVLDQSMTINIVGNTCEKPPSIFVLFIPKQGLYSNSSIAFYPPKDDSSFATSIYVS